MVFLSHGECSSDWLGVRGLLISKLNDAPFERRRADKAQFVGPGRMRRENRHTLADEYREDRKNGAGNKRYGVERRRQLTAAHKPGAAQPARRQQPDNRARALRGTAHAR